MSILFPFERILWQRCYFQKHENFSRMKLLSKQFSYYNKFTRHETYLFMPH